MQGMQGVVLLVSGYVLLVTLAAPTALLASEEQEPAATRAAVEMTPVAPAAGSDAAQPPAEPVETTAGPPQGGKRGASAAATRTVAMRDIKFKPRNITIDRGDTVRWENEDAERHNAIGEDDSFETPVIDQGESSQHTFNGGGKIDYFCTLHANMDGTITVRGSGGGGGGSGGGGGAGGTTESGSTGGTSAGSGSGSTGSGSTGSGSTGTTGATGTTSSSGSSSSLPVTGVEMLWLALAGYGLLTFGATLWLLVVRED